MKLKTQRNDPCPCGSGKKYKQCCANLQAPASPRIASGANEQPSLFNKAFKEHQAGNVVFASTLYDDILIANPRHAHALHLRGMIAMESGDFRGAITRFRNAIEINNADPHYYYHLGTALLKISEHAAAIEQLEAAIALRPDYTLAYGNLASALRGVGDFAGAVAAFEHTIRLNPADVVAYGNLGATLVEQGDNEAAVAILAQGLLQDERHAPSYEHLCAALIKLGRTDEAEELALAAIALELEPGSPRAYSALADIRRRQGRMEESVDFYRRVIAAKPDDALNYSNLLMSYQYLSSMTPDELFSEHLGFSEQFEAPLRASWLSHDNLKDPHRRLKIGYVSADFRNHAVASFIEPIFAHHDPEQFEIYCYYNHAHADAVSDRLRQMVEHWVCCKSWSEDRLAAAIGADGIDILIDLSGHTAENRLLTFARKPAPLQASWIGYPGTTGLMAMDYYIADRFFIPVGQLEDQFSEKVVRLPVASTFQPYGGAPDVNLLPAFHNGAVTFGSFNQPHKFTSGVIALWSELLRAVPDARLLVAGMPKTTDTDAIAAVFSAHGVDARRLQFHERCNLDHYMALHQQVDICLDTFPYTGGTTTLHAAWMGVPTLTLAGHTPAGRQGCVVPGHLDLESFVASDGADFVRKGAEWTRNLPALAVLRSTMRERFRQSALLQPAQVTAWLEIALRHMWGRYCVGLEAQSFELTQEKRLIESDQERQRRA